jgi:hypothetical protein
VVRTAAGGLLAMGGRAAVYDYDEAAARASRYFAGGRPATPMGPRSRCLAGRPLAPGIVHIKAERPAAFARGDVP